MKWLEIDELINSQPIQESSPVPESVSQPCKAYALENNTAISNQQESQQSGIDSIAMCSIASDIQEKQASLHGKSRGTHALITDGDIDNGATKSNTRSGKGQKRKMSTDNDMVNEAEKTAVQNTKKFYAICAAHFMPLTANN